MMIENDTLTIDDEANVSELVRRLEAHFVTGQRFARMHMSREFPRRVWEELAERARRAATSPTPNSTGSPSATTGHRPRSRSGA